MLPVLALVGRPNVGKSTLFNRLTNTRDALVADFPGLTRDRKYGQAKVEDRQFIVIDTGGITGDEAGIDAAMAEQSLLAIDEADVVLFLVDARAGLTAADQGIAEYLRKQKKQSMSWPIKSMALMVIVKVQTFMRWVWGTSNKSLPRMDVAWRSY